MLSSQPPALEGGMLRLLEGASRRTKDPLVPRVGIRSVSSLGMCSPGDCHVPCADTASCRRCPPCRDPHAERREGRGNELQGAGPTRGWKITALLPIQRHVKRKEKRSPPGSSTAQRGPRCLRERDPRAALPLQGAVRPRHADGETPGCSRPVLPGSCSLHPATATARLCEWKRDIHFILCPFPRGHLPNPAVKRVT